MILLAVGLLLATLLPTAAAPPDAVPTARPTTADALAQGTGAAPADAPGLFGPAPGANLSAAWDHTRGDPGVTVAVVDSGVERSHEALDRVLQGWDAVDRDATPEDTCGHGTEVAGILSAAPANGGGAVGAANVSVLPIKVLEAGPEGCDGSTEDLARAIDRAAAVGADVIAVPLGCPPPCADEDVAAAVERARLSGSLVVASAGNDPDAGLYFPAALPDALAVGALDGDGTPRYGDFPGPGPDLLAPGDSLRTTTVDDGYGRLSGASAAVPVAAAAAALVLSVSDLSPDDVSRVLQASADDTGAEPAAQGYGAVDAGAAVELADGNVPEAPPGLGSTPSPAPGTPPARGSSSLAGAGG